MKAAYLFLMLGAGIGVGLPALAADPRADIEFFENKIQPILSANCYKCHSASAGKTKGELALDSKHGLLKGGSGGAVIVPGDPASSRLIQAVSNRDPDLKMPPQGKLSAQQIADLTEWIKRGAPDPRDESQVSDKGKLTGITDQARAHWAYQPVQKPAVPAVRGKTWVRTPIDAFILAKLEERGIQPNKPAAKEDLLRRATFDLIGLPPTTDELQAFLADTSVDAFGKVVDRLLASPHFGERWGRHWLDTARYSDTGGDIRQDSSAGFRLPYASVYRDYVIDAFNTDKPYDRFILEQIAADKLPLGDDNSVLAALGFLTVGERFVSANDIINERIDAVCKGFLALTVACARCHDHSFDPIPTADYYSLHGIFNNVVEPREKPIIGKPNAQTADYESKVAAMEQENRDLYYKAIERYGDLFRKKAGTYMLAARHYQTRGTIELMALRREALEKGQLDPDFFEAGGGDWIRRRNTSDPIWGPLVRFDQLRPEEFATRGRVLAEEIATGGKDAYNPRVVALFKGSAPESLGEVEQRYNKLFAELESQARAYLRASSRSGVTKQDLIDYDPALVQLLEIPLAVVPAGQITITHLPEFTVGWPILVRGRIPFAEIGKTKNWLDLTHPGAPKRAGVVEDVPYPRDSPIFIRGQSQVKGPIVPRRFLEALSGPLRPEFNQGSGRLELGRAIASRDNPLTARVAVNRVWMHHFGEGFVSTPDDLGVQSDMPSHPELIDWLAQYFMDGGWSFKKLHRLIMLSNVYQQSSRNNPRYAEVDANNRLLWRANIRRLEIEAVRDSLLVFSGNLDATLGGQPINLTDEPYSFRRSVYGYVDRVSLPELLQQFDFSDPRVPTSKRATTIAPPQALFFMNSPMVVDVSRKIVERKEFTSQPDDAGRVAALYRIIFQRQPTPEEGQLGQAYLNDLKPRLAAPGAQLKRAAAVSRPTEAPKRKRGGQGRQAIENEGQRVERNPLTAWELYAQALLFSNEVAFVK